MASTARIEQVLQSLGFTSNPFILREADREGRKDLWNYFFQHSLFPQILGREDTPESTIVIAQRGAGKTTFRQAIELYCRQRWSPVEHVLDVPYIDFSGLLREAQGQPEVDIRQHVDEILRCSVARLLETLNEVRVQAFNQLPYSDLAMLSAYVRRYSPLLEEEDWGHTVNRLLHRIAEDNVDAPLPPFDASLLFRNPDLRLIALLPPPVQSVAEFLVRLAQQAPRRLNQGSYLQLVRDFLELLVPLGYRAMYVLVDRVDENSLRGTAEERLRFLKPLLTALDLLDEPYLAFKIFLPQHLHDNISGIMDFRHKRLPVHSLLWTDDDLLDMLGRRLKGFNRAGISSLQILCEPSLGQQMVAFSRRNPKVRYVDAALVQAANGLPRDLILRCRNLLQIFSARDSRGLITEADLRAALEMPLPSEEPAGLGAEFRRPAPSADLGLPFSQVIPRTGLYIDANEDVWRDGKLLETQLSPLEFKLLQYLYEHRGQLCTREKILLDVWDLPPSEVVRLDARSSQMALLYSTLKRLRAAVEYNPAQPRFIETLARRGIRLLDQREAAASLTTAPSARDQEAGAEC